MLVVSSIHTCSIKFLEVRVIMRYYFGWLKLLPYKSQNGRNFLSITSRREVHAYIHSRNHLT